MLFFTPVSPVLLLNCLSKISILHSMSSPRVTGHASRVTCGRERQKNFTGDKEEEQEKSIFPGFCLSCTSVKIFLSIDILTKDKD